MIGRADAGDLVGQIAHLGAGDEFLPLEHAAQKQADDHQHDGNFDQGKSALKLVWFVHCELLA